MWLTDMTFIQTLVTFCEYLVFHELRRTFYITLAKYLEQEGIADLPFFFKFCVLGLLRYSSNLMRRKF